MRLFLLLLMSFFILGTGCPIKKEKKQEDKRNRPTALQDFPSQVVSQKSAQTVSSLNIPCFVYHRFGERRYPSTNISTEVFRQHLQFLKSNNYRVLTLGKALDLLKENGKTSEKVAVISVDDGYHSFLTGAMPLLREFKFQATLFINTQTVGSPGYMDWDELKKIKQDGIEIGNHTHSHAFFLNGPIEGMAGRFKKDVESAQILIEANLGSACDLFAYPYGELNAAMKEVVESLGFRAAAAQNSGVIYGGSDLFALPRFPMGGYYATLEGFKEKVAMKALPVELIQPLSGVISDKKRPKLQIMVASEAVDLSQVNCFVQGNKNCTIQRKGNRFTIQSETPLNRRRTLYTITAPSKDNSSWHWYSYLWIQPDIRQ